MMKRILLKTFAAALALALTTLCAANESSITEWVTQHGIAAQNLIRSYFYFALFFGVMLTLLIASPSRGFRKFFSRVILLLIYVASLEAASAIAYLELYDRSFYTLQDPPEAFEQHPYLVAVPRKNYQSSNAMIGINSLGTRGREITPHKPRGTVRIAALGGSSTFCISLRNDSAWPQVLEDYFGQRVEVLNLGTPGYTSVENVIQAAFEMPQLETDIALVYAGWNDARMSVVANLDADYSQTHGRGQFNNLGIAINGIWRGPAWALAWSTQHLLVKFGLLYQFPSDFVVVGGRQKYFPDLEAEVIYRRNLRSIAALTKATGIIPVFVPQIMNRAAMGNTEAGYGWAPFLTDAEFLETIDRYNDIMKAVAAETGSTYLESALSENWNPEDFIDYGHFSADGSEKFAFYLRKELHPLVLRVIKEQSQIGPT